MESKARRGPGLPWSWVALGVALLAAGGILTFAIAQPVKVLPRMEPAPVFELASAAGGTFRSHEREGRVVIYLFGASRDQGRIQQLLELMRGTAFALADRDWLGTRAELALISLDPEFDTPEVLADLARSARLAPWIGGSFQGAGLGFEGPGIQLLSGPPVAVKLAAGSGFGIYYEPPAPVDDGLHFVYEPTVVIVDGAGTVRARYRAEAIGVETLMRDVDLLLEEADAEGASRLLFAGAHLFLCYVP